MKFKIDENLPEELSALLCDAGWDSTTVIAQELGGAIDPEIARICREELRVLVTFDRGFSNIRAYPPARRDVEVEISVLVCGARERRCHTLFAQHPPAPQG